MEQRRELIAQAQAIADFRPPKDDELMLDQVQQLADLLGLEPEKEPKRTPKKRQKPMKQRPAKKRS